MKSKLATSLVAVLFITGCTSGNNVSIEKPKENKFSTLADLKQAFVDAGGQCWGWKEDLSVPLEELGWIGKGECDSKTVLILYEDGVSVEEDALNTRKHNEFIGFKTSLLFGKNWKINSDQVEIVYPKMGGTLMTR